MSSVYPRTPQICNHTIRGIKWTLLINTLVDAQCLIRTNFIVKTDTSNRCTNPCFSPLTYFRLENKFLRLKRPHIIYFKVQQQCRNFPRPDSCSGDLGNFFNTTLRKHTFSVIETPLHLFSNVWGLQQHIRTKIRTWGNKNWKSVKGCVGFWNPSF